MKNFNEGWNFYPSSDVTVIRIRETFKGMKNHHHCHHQCSWLWEKLFQPIMNFHRILCLKTLIECRENCLEWDAKNKKIIRVVKIVGWLSNWMEKIEKRLGGFFVTSWQAKLFYLNLKLPYEWLGISLDGVKNGKELYHWLFNLRKSLIAWICWGLQRVWSCESLLRVNISHQMLSLTRFWHMKEVHFELRVGNNFWKLVN